MPYYFKFILVIFAFYFFIFFACNQNTSDGKLAGKSDTVNAPAPIVEQTKNSPVENYDTSNTAFSEQLSISRLSDDSIQFKWVITEKKQTATETMQGIAVKNTSGELEMDEDETGLSYPAEEYIYKKGECYLYIRLSVDLQKKRVVIKAANCNLISYKSAQHKSSLAIVE